MRVGISRHIIETGDSREGEEEKLSFAHSFFFFPIPICMSHDSLPVPSQAELADFQAYCAAHAEARRLKEKLKGTSFERIFKNPDQKKTTRKKPTAAAANKVKKGSEVHKTPKKKKNKK